MQIHLLSAVLVLCVVTAQGERSKSFPVPEDHPHLKHITGDNFRALAIESTEPIIIEIYHGNKRTNRNSYTTSKQLAPAVEALSEALSPIVPVYVLDAESSAGKELLTTYGIGNTPVILLFNSDLMPIAGAADGAVVKMPIGYQGDGSVGHMTRWALGSLSHVPVERVSLEASGNRDPSVNSLAHFLGKYSHLEFPKVLLLLSESDQPATPPLYLSIAQKYRYGAVFGVTTVPREPSPSRAYEWVKAHVIDPLGLKQWPALVSLKPSGFGKDQSFEVSLINAFPPDADSPFSTSDAAEEAPHDESTFSSLAAAKTQFDRLDSALQAIVIPHERRSQLVMTVAAEEQRDRRKAQEMSRYASALEPIVLAGSGAAPSKDENKKLRDQWADKCIRRKKGVCLVVFREGADFASSLLLEAKAAVASGAAPDPDADLEDLSTDARIVKELSEFDGNVAAWASAAEERKVDLALLRNISRKATQVSKNSALQVVVVDGTRNYRLVNAFGLTNGLPAVIAVYPAKRQYFHYVGPLSSEKNILSFITDKVLRGTASRSLPQKLPRFLGPPTAKDQDASNANDEL